MLRLLLPILMPSWRFFDRVGPVIRIECPAHVIPASKGWLALLGRLFINSQRNEYLFQLTLAERIVFENNRDCIPLLQKRLGAAHFRILVGDEVKYEC